MRKGHLHTQAPWGHLASGLQASRPEGQYLCVVLAPPAPPQGSGALWQQSWDVNTRSSPRLLAPEPGLEGSPWPQPSPILLSSLPPGWTQSPPVPSGSSSLSRPRRVCLSPKDAWAQSWGLALVLGSPLPSMPGGRASQNRPLPPSRLHPASGPCPLSSQSTRPELWEAST